MVKSRSKISRIFSLKDRHFNEVISNKLSVVCEEASVNSARANTTSSCAAMAATCSGGVLSALLNEYCLVTLNELDWNMDKQYAETMQMVVQNYRNGNLSVRDVPTPQPHVDGLLVETKCSLVSAGTERLITQTAKKSLIGKARARPDLVKRVLQKAKTDGIKETYRAVRSRLDQTIPLGYSSSGVVKVVSPGVNGFAIGDRVACFGAGYASHAEMASVPAALTCKIPESVPFEKASFAGVGAIALHSVNLAALSKGQKVVVIGLGLIGSLAVQVLVARGYQVYGIEPNAARADLAKAFGAVEVFTPKQATRASTLATDNSFSGFSAALVFASSLSDGPVNSAAQMLRANGKLVVPGMVNLNLDRQLFYEKEIELVVPRSAGPGSETAGIVSDSIVSIPTAAENIAEFLLMLEQGDINVDRLTTDKFSISDAALAYEALDRDTNSIGILIDYSDKQQTDSLNSSNRTTPRQLTSNSKTGINLGVVGAGLWAKNTLIPEFSNIDGVSLLEVVSRSPENANHVAEKWGFENAGTSARYLLESDEIDAVVIATRHDTHADLAIQAVSAAKHVLVEKPPAVNMSELERLAEVVKATDTIFHTGFNRRHAPDSIAAREFVSNQRVAISCRVNPGSLPPGHWTTDKAQGGRVIGETCHFVDLLNFIAGSPIIRVSAESIDGVSGTPETIAACFAHQNGSVSNLLYGADGDKAYQRELVEIVGAGGVFIIDDFRGHTKIVNGKRKRKKRYGIDRGHRDEIRSFISAIRNPAGATSTFDTVYESMSATFALASAARNHSTVELGFE